MIEFLGWAVIQRSLGVDDMADARRARRRFVAALAASLAVWGALPRIATAAQVQGRLLPAAERQALLAKLKAEDAQLGDLAPATRQRVLLDYTNSEYARLAEIPGANTSQLSTAQKDDARALVDQVLKAAPGPEPAPTPIPRPAPLPRPRPAPSPQPRPRPPAPAPPPPWPVPAPAPPPAPYVFVWPEAPVAQPVYLVPVTQPVYLVPVAQPVYLVPVRRHHLFR